MDRFARLKNAGLHGFSEILNAYTSGVATSGTAFAVSNANTSLYNLTLAAAMFASAGSLPIHRTLLSRCL
jgi:K+-transporting ATPase A subunit